ncbi:hypothetical protein MPB2EB_0160 [Mycoavidus sp. B2-EB]|nr:hypothetical protein MPB2EB_0160 [Mycoavidus sp. B2-EB]
MHITNVAHHSITVFSLRNNPKNSARPTDQKLTEVITPLSQKKDIPLENCNPSSAYVKQERLGMSHIGAPKNTKLISAGGLPAIDDVWFEILKKLPPSDMVRFRDVCFEAHSLVMRKLNYLQEPLFTNPTEGVLFLKKYGQVENGFLPPLCRAVASGEVVRGHILLVAELIKKDSLPITLENLEEAGLLNHNQVNQLNEYKDINGKQLISLTLKKTVLFLATGKIELNIKVPDSHIATESVSQGLTL